MNFVSETWLYVRISSLPLHRIGEAAMHALPGLCKVEGVVPVIICGRMTST